MRESMYVCIYLLFSLERASNQGLQGCKLQRRERRMGREPPPDASLYLDPHYWDERFSEEEHYEWFKGYSHFRHLIRPNVSQNDLVLELGCGNSRLGIEMFEDGVQHITCTDLSVVAIEKMQGRLERTPGCPGISLVVANMLELPFRDESFDVILEKGAMDVLLVDGGDPWDPKPETKRRVLKMLGEVHRVLKPNGLFISISFGQPHFRQLLFEDGSFSWSMECKTFGDGFHYFFYLLRKGTKGQQSDSRHGRMLERTKLDLFQEQMEIEDYLLQTLID